VAGKLLDMGYEPIPIVPARKRPAPNRWSTIPIDERQVEQWCATFPDHGVGLRTGRLVGLDIDLLDDDLAFQVHDLARHRLGDSLVRVGRWPKRMLVYRTDRPFPKIDVKPLEVLGVGQQFVAFGTHPGTGRPYGWPLGETPLDVPLDDLPVVDHARMLEFVAEARAILPDMAAPSSARRAGAVSDGGVGIERDADGLVVDGRDDWLSRIAFHTLHDALDRAGDLSAERLAALAWDRFAESADLSRPRQDGSASWTPRDALQKVREKLRLHGRGDLPPRRVHSVEASYEAPEATAEVARAQLASEIAKFCETVLLHHGSDLPGDPPRLGLKATTGLGKSSVARRLFLDLRRKLRAVEAPDRFLVFTPSHALAEETAEAWRAMGVTVAVMRGYHRKHPVTGRTMCADTEAVDAALAAGSDPHRTVCRGKGGATCPHFHGCLKQENRAEVRAADVVVAPYDGLYTGFAVDPAGIAAIIVDEGCWARATRITPSLTVEALTTDLLPGLGAGMEKHRAASRRADHQALRAKLQRAMLANGAGPILRRHLVEAGLTPEECEHAIGRERTLLANPRLAPGLTGDARKKAFAAARRNGRIRSVTRIWDMVAKLIDSENDAAPRLRVEKQGDVHRIATIDIVSVDEDLADKPVLHLDATLRPAIASRLLPGLEVMAVEAAAPHMAVHLVTGSFGKTVIVPDDRASREENARRTNNLADCVDHIRWHARRLAPGRVLVVTYKSVEKAFSHIPGVVTGHFNAMAGLDGYRDVAAIFIVGRPLPRDADLSAPCAALFDHASRGGYVWQAGAVRMRDGSSRTVRVMRHEDETAEIIRAAICDDELVQDIGRGRGVNRTSESPLEVHVLADVALPLVHDRVVDWNAVKPDLVQRMLMAGIAVDSPADAVRLHPEMFANEKLAQKVFERIGFKRQIPIGIYRGMSLKSAQYKRAGRGRSWQTAWWLADLDGRDVQDHLEASLGALDWKMR